MGRQGRFVHRQHLAAGDAAHDLQALLEAGVRLADPARFDLRGSLQAGQDVDVPDFGRHALDK